MSAVMPVSDLRLQELANEPARDLFPIMNSSVAFAPWNVILAFLPPLAGVLTWSLDDRTAVWGLRALEAAHQSTAVSPVPWSDTISVATLNGAPPLATWLVAGLMAFLEIPLPLGLTGVSYLSVAITILMAARLSRRLGVPRLASLTVLCCVGSPLLLNSAHVGGPEALGLCLMTVSLERFFAHLDAAVSRWSGRLLLSALAWGGCWLAIGWPALTLGAALSVHAVIYGERQTDRTKFGEFVPVGRTPMHKFRRSLVVWWIVGLATGTWWLWGAVRDFGFVSTMAWLFDPTPNAISPLYPNAAAIGRWGASIGLTFLLGWIVLGLAALMQHQPKVLSPAGEGRGIALVLLWIALFVCRVATAASGADPTLWDLLQTVPACLTAAIGMEVVLQRSLSAAWLISGIGVGLLSLAVHVPRDDSPAMQAALALGAVILSLPILFNLIQARSLRWNERQTRSALRGLLVSTWVACFMWSVGQSVATSTIDKQLAAQLIRVRETIPAPGAVVIVSQAEPSRSLVYQVRRHWRQAPLVIADRWEAAISRTLSTVDNWADTEFLVVELTRRDSQFRRPGTGWIVTAMGEPRRYYGDQMTLHRVSIQSP